MKVAIYCRVALANQRSVDSQIAFLDHFAREQGFTDISWYVDNGYSGLSFDRPAFLEMESTIQSGEVGTVLVRNISRIGRNMIDTMWWIHELEKRGIRFITADNPDGEHSYSLRIAMEQLAREYAATKRKAARK